MKNLPLKTHTVTFSKAGWLTVSTTVSANQFDDNNAATADATMVNTSAKISGTVTDAKNNDAPLSGVSVSTESDTTTTGEDGTFLIENLLEGDYTITFTKDTYETVTEGSGCRRLCGRCGYRGCNNGSRRSFKRLYPRGLGQC